MVLPISAHSLSRRIRGRRPLGLRIVHHLGLAGLTVHGRSPTRGSLHVVHHRLLSGLTSLAGHGLLGHVVHWHTRLTSSRTLRLIHRGGLTGLLRSIVHHRLLARLTLLLLLLRVGLSTGRHGLRASSLLRLVHDGRLSTGVVLCC